LGVTWCPKYHQLRVWNDWTPKVAEVMGSGDSYIEILNIMVYFAQSEVDEWKAESVGIAMVTLLT